MSRVELKYRLNRKINFAYGCVSHCVIYWFIFAADIDECASDPCMNDGTCTDLVNGFSCNCTDNYNGSRCNIGKIILKLAAYQLCKNIAYNAYTNVIFRQVIYSS